MKIIKLTQGQVSVVDDDEFDRINQHKWHAQRYKQTYYAATKIDGNIVRMHRFILNVANPSIQVDHRNRNGLDNQKQNLRLCSQSDNNKNKTKKKNATSKYLGVCRGQNGRWQAGITINYKRKYLGNFSNEKDAALAYNEAAKKYHGKFANLNKL